MEIVTTLFTMDAALTEGSMEAQQQQIAGAGEKLQGKQEELTLREKMLETSATLNAQVAGSGATAGSGTMQVAHAQARKRGRKEVITTRSNTKQRILERQMKGAQAKTRGYARATSAGLKYASDMQKRAGKVG